MAMTNIGAQACATRLMPMSMAVAKLRATQVLLWQTRLSDQGKTQTCYKYIAETDPFLNGPNPELTTSAWDIALQIVLRADLWGECTNGIYAGLGRCVGNVPGALHLST